MPYNLGNIKLPAGSKKQRKRVARGEGSGSGSTAGRGNKGQKSRSGGGKGPGFEGGQTPLYRRLPKLGGFTNIHRPARSIINLRDLDGFEAGSEINLEVLKAKGLADKKATQLRVLAEGKLAVPLKIIASHFSAKAREIIQAAGGSCEVK